MEKVIDEAMVLEIKSEEEKLKDILILCCSGGMCRGNLIDQLKDGL